jgi:hypothetical protein
MTSHSSDDPFDPSRQRAARLCFLQTAALLLVALIPLPAGWVRARSALESARSLELNRADRDATAGGYYEGLIGHGDGPKGRQNELDMLIHGQPADWARIQTASVTRPLPDRDFLQFELKPNVNKMLFGHAFTTNAHGMRDHAYTVEKPPGIFRIAVLGSSMDMGWGIGTSDTYVNLLEDWLNAHAATRGLGTGRRFEVLNFAVAAYSPLQRLEAFRRKVKAFKPDMVLYSATMLDTRLMEIHLCDLFRAKAELRYDFLDRAVADAGLSAEDLRIDADEKLAHKETVKKKLRPFYWPIYDATLGTLAADCRSEGIVLAAVIIPRVGKADAPAQRAESVARLQGIAAHQAVPLWDLSDTFDGQDPTEFAIASWDDHPNAQGHRRLFLALTRALVKDRVLYDTLFPPGTGARPKAEPDGDVP